MSEVILTERKRLVFVQAFMQIMSNLRCVAFFQSNRLVRQTNRDSMSIPVVVFLLARRVHGGRCETSQEAHVSGDGVYCAVVRVSLACSYGRTSRRAHVSELPKIDSWVSRVWLVQPALHRGLRLVHDKCGLWERACLHATWVWG